MLTTVLDGFVSLAPRCGLRLLRGVAIIPVLHIERLYQDASYLQALAFARDYWTLTGQRALYTVITPASRQLRAELASAGFDEAHYARRITALAEHCDIGVHGHFLRESGTGYYPIHSYWNETGVVREQLAAECEWLESRGLMRRRVYSAGWWYVDDMIMAALRDLGFQFDFSCSTVGYNLSSFARQRLTGSRPPPAVDNHGGPDAVWAVAGLGGGGRYPAVPRRVLSALGWGLRTPTPKILSLYSHDWDLNPGAAIRSVRALVAHGASFTSLETLATADSRTNPDGARSQA